MLGDGTLLLRNKLLHVFPAKKQMSTHMQSNLTSRLNLTSGPPQKEGSHKDLRALDDSVVRQPNRSKIRRHNSCLKMGKRTRNLSQVSICHCIVWPVLSISVACTVW